MGYSARPTGGKKRAFKLLFEESDYTDKKRQKRCRGIPVEQWGMHGFRPDMTLQEARAKASTLNAASEEKRHHKRKVAITEEIRRENLVLATAVPDEPLFIKHCEEEHQIKFKGPNKLESHWQCTKKLLTALELQPKDYFEQRRQIYRWFESKRYSVDYLKKVLRFLNLYGDFTASLYSQYFKPVPYPKGKNKQDIANAHRKSGKASKKAKPLSWEILSASKERWIPAQFNWMYLSLWLGLRPEEVDAMKREESYRWESAEAEGVTYPVIVVYQTKLERTVDEEDRWKRIPLLYPEQQCIPALIEGGEIERPLVKTIRNLLGRKGYGTYSGRKGFEELLEKRGQPFHFISAMLGHLKPDITYAKYMDRSKARFVPPKKGG